MIRLAALTAVVLILGGCFVKPARNSPAQQVEDYKTCTGAGMGAYQNPYGEIMCRPPQEAQ